MIRLRTYPALPPSLMLYFPTGLSRSSWSRKTLVTGTLNLFTGSKNNNKIKINYNIMSVFFLPQLGISLVYWLNLFKMPRATIHDSKYGTTCVLFPGKCMARL